MVIVFGFDDGDRDIRFQVKDEIRAFPFTPDALIPFYKNTAVGEKDLFSDLLFNIPPSFD